MNGAPALLKGGRYVRAHGRPLGLLLWTRCRKCGPCLGRRRNLWAARARDEVARSARTWFATFTLAPWAHQLMEMRASARLREGGSIWRLLTADERFSEVAQEYSAEVTKWLKRVRKNSGARLRYILVAERHKSGRLHFHALIHEVESSLQVTHAVLTSAWKLGFTKFKLVERDVKACWYVAKYLAKDAASRVRASLAYGNGGEPKTNERRGDSVWPTERPRVNGSPSLEGTERENNVSVSKQSENFEMIQTINQQGEDHDDLYDDFSRRREVARERAAADRRSRLAQASRPRSPAGLQAPEAAALSEAARRAKQESSAIRAVQALAAAFGAAWSTGKAGDAPYAPTARRASGSRLG